jgi:hypothetical protein
MWYSSYCTCIHYFTCIWLALDYLWMPQYIIVSVSDKEAGVQRVSTWPNYV